MGLKEYNKKRKFEATPEPEGKEESSGQNRFVIQRHQARRLHYDLRLEMDGVLKSWAVPKGPSMNPEDKRLAIHTEDHPVEYLTFHGTIPKGNYGAGKMNIWDTGTYQTSENPSAKSPAEQIEKGRLKVIFNGKKIKGTFSLVRTNRGEEQNQWLLVKKKDEFATDEKYDAENLAETDEKPESKIVQLNPNHFIKPMLATATKNIFDDNNWIYEIKWDGYRMVSHILGGEVQLYSRNGISFNQKFKLLAKDLRQISQDVVLDGEVVLVDKNGIPQFQRLQHYDEQTLCDLRYYVFDMLWLNGHSMLNLPLIDRKSLIPDVIADLNHTFYCDHIETDGTDFFEDAVEQGLEGVIAKKADSRYFPGVRTENWLKIKAVKTQEVLICGYTEPSEGSGYFGSLVLGVHRNGELEYAGNCGSGFSQNAQKELLKKMKKLETDKRPFSSKINTKGRKIHWMKPELICEVKFTEWTDSGSLRHPVYLGLRSDKNPPEITPEPNVEEPPENEAEKSGSSNLNVDGISVPISNLEKVFWPESGLRKYDLIDYYLQVSDVMLPFLIDRPQNLHRHPNGIDKKSFYQKDNQALPPWIETVSIYSESGRKNIEYMLCQKEATLLYMANLACIEIHPWSSRVGQLDSPDFGIIDIDPSEKNTFEEVIEVAQAVHEVLKLAKIEGYCKTSGSAGLHIYLPMEAKYSYEEVRDFIKLICYYVLDELPELTSMERAVKSRKGKIYLDYLQNRRGQTIAAPYCVRPKKGATVSAPLKWSEVKKGLDFREFNLKTMPGRIKETGELFLPVLQKGIDMEKALENLNNV